MYGGEVAGLGVAGVNAYGEPGSSSLPGVVRLQADEDRSAGKREGTAWSKRGSNDRRGIQHNPYKIQFFKAFTRREHCLGGV